MTEPQVDSLEQVFTEIEKQGIETDNPQLVVWANRLKDIQALILDGILEQDTSNREGFQTLFDIIDSFNTCCNKFSEAIADENHPVFIEMEPVMTEAVNKLEAFVHTLTFEDEEDEEDEDVDQEDDGTGDAAR